MQGLWVLLSVFSPTFIYADIRKNDISGSASKDEIAKLMVNFNRRYFTLSMFWLIFFSCPVFKAPYGDLSAVMVAILIWVLPFSRCNEIFYAFIRDALDTFDNKESKKSSLTYRERVEMAFFSYLELIFNFAVIYFVLPVDFFKGVDKEGFSSIAEAVYFSGVTITTLGYGDIKPIRMISQLLTVYEVLCGFILLLVCFTIYTNKGLSPNNENKGKVGEELGVKIEIQGDCFEGKEKFSGTILKERTDE